MGGRGRIVPEFDAKKLCKALEKLGFERCPAGNHQYKYKHTSLTPPPPPARPFVVVPTNLRKDRKLQGAIFKDLVRVWRLDPDALVEALGK